VPGDGTYRTKAVSLDAAGFYTYRERIAGTPLGGAVETSCGLAPETALAAPQIVTGRGDVARTVLARAVVDAPTRVRIASQGLDAPIAPVGIDVRQGVLGVPADIGRTGWWRDGMAPGARTGAILVAGHVDSARAGAGAFFRLTHVHAGEVVELTTAAGRRFRYRVTSVKAMAKAKLPLDVYSRRGAPRLVLVTCGGPFDQAQGHYRDNVVVTAVPL
jgi:hypothetical protein